MGQKTNRHTKINMQVAQIPQVDEAELMDFLSTPKKRSYDSQIEYD